MSSSTRARPTARGSMKFVWFRGGRKSCATTTCWTSAAIGSPSMSARLTVDIARRILAEQLDGKGTPDLDAELDAIQSGPDERVELLPIMKEAVSEPPAARESRPSKPRQSSPSLDPPEAPVKLRRSEVAVYALAALVVATSIVAMSLLMRP